MYNKLNQNITFKTLYYLIESFYNVIHIKDFCVDIFTMLIFICIYFLNFKTHGTHFNMKPSFGSIKLPLCPSLSCLHFTVRK